jgi:hypothetical protein
MPDPNSKPETDAALQASLAPEVHNSEQDDEQAQAHTLADEALGRAPRDYGSPTDSIKVNGNNYEEDSTQDLVDHMRDMERSGRIDMGAYLGEDNMDDEEGKYGETSADE